MANTLFASLFIFALTVFQARPVLSTYGWPFLSYGGHLACPDSRSGWLDTGINGGIVDPDNDNWESNGTPNMIYHFYPTGVTGVTSAARCKSLCQMWPDVGGRNLLPINGNTKDCAYWSWNGEADCYLYSCGVCKSAVSFSTKARCGVKEYVSGALDTSLTCGGGGVKGDPHFTGADQSHFDFTGVPDQSYCLVSDSHLHINAFYGGRYAAWGNETSKPMTWIRQVGILWGHHTIRLVAREGAEWSYQNGYMSYMEVDGEQVKLTQEGDSVRVGNGDIELTWLSAREQSGDDEIDVYQLKIEGVLTLRLTLRPEVENLRTSNDGVVHFNLDFSAIDLSNNAHGVLGQTYRSDHKGRLANAKLVYNDQLGVHMVEGSNAEGFLDGVTSDYSSSGIMTPDCRMSRFARVEKLDEETSRAIEMNMGSAISTKSAPRKALINNIYQV